jgi:large subunit ribosomal protein L30
MKVLKIKQVKSVVGCIYSHRDTVRSLGLRRIGQTVYHQDVPQIRGMIHSVNYLLSWELVDKIPEPAPKPAKGYTIIKPSR